MSQSEAQESALDPTSVSNRSVAPSNGADSPVDGSEGEAQPDGAGASAAQATESTPQPVVEILPPEEPNFEQDRYANMLVDRTQISLGLTGVSLKRTRMSGGGQTTGGQIPVDDQGRGAPSATSSAPPIAPQSGSPSPASVEPSSASDAQSAGTATESASSGGVQADSNLESSPGDVPDFENVQLLSQFLIGLASYGLQEVMGRIHYYDDAISRNPQEFDLDKQIDQAEETIETVFRYWLIGSLMWSERTALTLSYRTFQRSVSIGSFALRTADRTTDNFLLRPFRKPFERLIPSIHQDSQARIAEGRTVERRGHVLAEETLDDIVGDFIDYLAENPQLVDLISTSGLGLAGTVMDNGRQIGAVTDNAVENLIHKIFRRPKREDLPPSPFEGKPQTMYDPTSQHYVQDEKAKD